MLVQCRDMQMLGMLVPAPPIRQYWVMMNWFHTIGTTTAAIKHLSPEFPPVPPLPPW